MKRHHMKQHLYRTPHGVWEVEEVPLTPVTLAWIATFAGMSVKEVDLAMTQGQWVYAGGNGYAYL